MRHDWSVPRRPHRASSPLLLRSYLVLFLFSWQQDFSWFEYPIERFEEVVNGFMQYTKDFSAAHNGWMPLACASFFVERIPDKPHGWWSLKGKGFEKPGVSFSLDPLYGKPYEPIWEEFLKGALKFALAHGGRPALTQVSVCATSHILSRFMGSYTLVWWLTPLVSRLLFVDTADQVRRKG